MFDFEVRMIRVAFFALILPFSAAFAQAPLPERFDLPATQSLFERMRADPGFDLSKPAAFGFFFNSVDPARLAPIREQLEREGYRFVETHIDKVGRTWLQMARIEVHSAQSIVERNRRLYTLAETTGRVEYDGWDVTRNAK